MATINERLKHLSIQHLTVPQRKELGTIICFVYRTQTVLRYPIARIDYKEPDGTTHKTLSYPRLFIPTIDRIIIDFCSNNPPPKPKERSKITAKKPIYSAKKSV